MQVDEMLLMNLRKIKQQVMKQEKGKGKKGGKGGKNGKGGKKGKKAKKGGKKGKDKKVCTCEAARSYIICDRHLASACIH